MRAEPEPDAHRRAAEQRGDGEAGVPDAGIQESIETNPYAAPKAKVEPVDQVGSVWRQGDLVRMDRTGALPDRCVVCNAAAAGDRVAQQLYWSPPAWKICAGAAPFAVAGLGLAIEAWWMVALFWPMALALVIANFFVRKSLRVELGICTRHRRVRTVLRALSIVCMLGILGSTMLIGEPDAFAYVLLLGSIGGIILLAVLQSFTGIQGLKLKELTAHHAWLARTGKLFRAALPELPL